jgi:hypothetical protein
MTVMTFRPTLQRRQTRDASPERRVNDDNGLHEGRSPGEIGDGARRRRGAGSWTVEISSAVGSDRFGEARASLGV